MGKPTDETPSTSSPMGTRLPLLTRTLTKAQNVAPRRRRAETETEAQLEFDDDDLDVIQVEDEDDDTHEEDDAKDIKAPPKLRSVGSTTSEGSTGHKNEDRFVVRSGPHFHLLAVMDGHGGYKAADFVAERLYQTLETVFRDGGLEFNSSEMEKAVEALDRKFLTIADRMEDDSGACFNAVVLYWSRTEQTYQKLVLNCGDCRSVAREAPERVSNRASWRTKEDRTGNTATIIPLSDDHSAANRSEKLRVLEAGAFIRNRRIAGILEPFRSIGDLDLKGANMRGWVIPTPEIRASELLVGRTTIVVATDGVWSVLSNQRVMTLAHLELTDGGDSQTAAEAIADEAREMGSTDDITVLVVQV